MKKISILAMCVMVCMVAIAQNAAKYAEVDNISYSPSADSYAKQRCVLDVYYPKNVDNAPVVVWFHGGGLTGGNKFIPEELKNSGYVVIAANYRLLPTVKIDSCIEDAAAAVAWSFKHAKEYNGDVRKIYVSGHSAGGYLTSMVGLEKKWLQKYGIDADSIAGLIPFSGQAITHYAKRNMLGIGPLQATIDEHAPLTHVRPDCAPMVIISGDREIELYGRYEEQAYFWRMLKLVGHKNVSLHEMQGYDHGGMAHPAFKILKDFIDNN